MSRRHALIPHLAALAVISGCLWLTNWQLERADEKELLLERYHQRQPLALQALESPFSLPQPVTAEGTWMDDRQVLLDNRIRNRQPGVEVLTPFRLSDGTVVLVRRGWTGWPARDQALPDPPVPEDAGNRIAIDGVLAAPPGVGAAIGAAGNEAGWPRLLNRFDLRLLRAEFGPALIGAVVQLDPDHPAHLTGDEWQVVTFGPSRHRGYALTWASIATVVAGLWLVLGIQSFRKH